MNVWMDYGQNVNGYVGGRIMDGWLVNVWVDEFVDKCIVDG